jgi:hypothetical protein
MSLKIFPFVGNGIASGSGLDTADTARVEPGVMILTETPEIDGIIGLRSGMPSLTVFIVIHCGQ